MGLTKTGRNSGVVAFSSGRNIGVLLHIYILKGTAIEWHEPTHKSKNN